MKFLFQGLTSPYYKQNIAKVQFCGTFRAEETKEGSGFKMLWYGIKEYIRDLGNLLDKVWSTIIITLIVIVGVVVVGCLRFYCVIIKRQHSWERWPQTDFAPASGECRRCGKVE